MKLLYCPSCRELLRLVSYEVRSCTCNKVCRKYLEGGHRAVYHGPAVRIGLDYRALQGFEGPSKPLWVYDGYTSAFLALPSPRSVARATNARVADMRALETEILSAYTEDGSVTIRDLAAVLGRSPSSIYRAVRHLTSRGLLEKGKTPGSNYVTFKKVDD